MQPIQAKYGAEEFNHGSFFQLLKPQNGSKYAARTGHRKDAQSHKNDILGKSSNPLQKSYCSHYFSNAEGSPSDQHEGQLWAVQLCPEYVLTSKDQDYFSALCSVHALFLPVETRAQKVGDDVCLDTAKTFDMCMCEHGHNRA